MSDAGDAHAPGPEVGSLAEEAAKLFGALSGWARDQAGEAGEGLSGLAAHAATTAHDLNEHLATGSTECTVCPICRTVHAVRQLSPEVMTHLAAAATSLAQAAAAVMATPASREESDGVEHIDLSDDWPEDE
ncbi:hypothetical protein J2X46_002795 [Nocardioides sp. BE266]|uniref:hypothetical protein n=1 Tax=Nocardioides sp. BE266 TaxID=2817725 RepID=UPI00285A493B|nr:hypothetical protein [Nocardioides sp. BE266]MDR7253805.1 hypothetical protein [Nocardioides sp. BE266]